MAEIRDTQRDSTERDTALLALYMALGGLCGLLVGVVGAGAGFGYEVLHDQPPPRFRPDLMAYLFGGLFLGASAGPFLAVPLWLVTIFWSKARHPLSAASLCASVSGTIYLVVSCRILYDTQDRILMLLAVGAGLMVAAAMYGFLLTLLARRVERWWLIGPTQVPS